ncbi:hypothetical protein J7L02_01580 [Candidatus Woesearchaeota archaeon]|nr:hypothetical protein [Candidatus Woesearchaeota archaeon]
MPTCTNLSGKTMFEPGKSCAFVDIAFSKPSVASSEGYLTGAKGAVKCINTSIVSNVLLESIDSKLMISLHEIASF